MTSGLFRWITSWNSVITIPFLVCLSFTYFQPSLKHGHDCYSLVPLGLQEIHKADQDLLLVHPTRHVLLSCAGCVYLVCTCVPDLWALFAQSRTLWFLGYLVLVDLGRGRGQSPSQRLRFSETLCLLFPFSSWANFIQLSGTGKTGSDWSHFTPNLLFMPQVLGFWNLKLFFSPSNYCSHFLLCQAFPEETKAEFSSAWVVESMAIGNTGEHQLMFQMITCDWLVFSMKNWQCCAKAPRGYLFTSLPAIIAVLAHALMNLSERTHKTWHSWGKKADISSSQKFEDFPHTIHNRPLHTYKQANHSSCLWTADSSFCVFKHTKG